MVLSPQMLTKLGFICDSRYYYLAKSYTKNTT